MNFGQVKSLENIFQLVTEKSISFMMAKKKIGVTLKHFSPFETMFSNHSMLNSIITAILLRVTLKTLYRTIPTFNDQKKEAF